ncbi:hypothetical protein LOTGIDRAFT_237494 [Lottia gigantea]|uniref:EF-hand domain-containing protein n=1 Tax=Lottia gigantea TaxID=225164 RepID=V4BEH8_LOTGI|nr:hypothetical protein LOTGIDRAFT_237494 [Lottia gigantea]ESP04197.1 hypothetical protein LOTGIDRAFT_237494 [Lottia gigantea]
MLKLDLPWLADGYKPELKTTQKIEQEIVPYEDDNFSLCAEEYIDNYADIRISTPVVLRKPRIKSAVSRISCNSVPTGRATLNHHKRPFSARPPSSRRTVSQRLIKSAGTHRSLPSAPSLRTSFCHSFRNSLNQSRRSLSRRHDVGTPVDLIQDDGLVLNNTYKSAPYVSRHTRCYDESVISEPLLPQRLFFAGALPTGSHPTLSTSRPISAKSYQSGLVEEGLEEDVALRIQRYIDYHRPQTDAWGSGVDYQSKDNFLLRGYAPHFCTFTQKVHLHDRPVSSRTPREVWVDWDNDNGIGKDNDNEDDGCSQFDTDSRRSFSIVSGIDGRTTPSTTGPTIVDNDLTGTDRNTGDNKQTIGVVISPKKSDDNKKQQNNNKGVIRFGFPVSKPPHGLSNKTPKSKKPASKIHGNKKITKDDNNKKKVQTSSKKKTESDNDALELLNKIISSSNKDDDVKAENNDDTGNDEETVKTPRSPVTKKEKKEKEQPPPPVKEREVTPDPKTRRRSPSPVQVKEPDIRSEAPEVPLTVLPEPPDLPKLRTPEPPKEPKSQSKQRSAISSSISQKNKQETDFDTRSRPEFDINAAMEIPATESSSKSKIHQWLHGRLALSQQSSRFELPMDMKNLETMSPLEYLRRHCVISNRRQNLYQKIFLKNKDKSGLILLKDLEKGLNDVLVNGINSEQLEEFSRLLLIPNDVKIDCRLFSCIAAVVERLLYPKFLTADTADLPDFQKEKIECADFCALDWKFHGVKVNPPTERLIKSIQAVG